MKYNKNQVEKYRKSLRALCKMRIYKHIIYELPTLKFSYSIGTGHYNFVFYQRQ